MSVPTMAAKLTPAVMREHMRREWRAQKRTLHIEYHDLPEDSALGTVILTHGYRGQVDAPHFVALVDAYKNAGFHVIAVDLPGFGRSTPTMDFMHGQILSFSILVRVGKSLLYHALLSNEKSGKPIILVGYSLGALLWKRLLQIYPELQRYVAGRVAISEPLRVDNDHNVRRELVRLKLVLKPIFKTAAEICSLIPRTAARAFAKIPVAEYEPDEFSENDPHHYKKPMNAWTAGQILLASERAFAASGRIVIPELYAHGSKDETAPLDAVKDAIVRSATPSEKKKLAVYDDIDHLLLQRNPAVIGDIIAWSVECARNAPPRNPVHPHIGLIEKSIRGLVEIIIDALRSLARLVWSDVIVEFWRKIRATIYVRMRGKR